MPTGTVKFYNRKNKFGFIKVDDTGQEIYVRQSGLIDAINEGDKVEFDLTEHPKGPIASNVKIIKS